MIVFTPGLKERNLKPFIKSAIKDVDFIDSHYMFPDWRQNAMMALLDKSNASYFMNMEQDFLITPENLYKVLSKIGNYDFIGYKEGDRIHPAFSIIKREFLYLTSKDFSAYPDKGLDHFGLFFKEMNSLTKYKDIGEFGLVDRKDFIHAGGLTQNYHCFREGQPFYKPSEFLTYNALIQKVPVVQSPEFLSYSEAITKAFGNPNDETIKSFFPVTSY